MANFLITGGAGFIGSNYLNLMVARYKDDFFLCLDALTYAGNINNIKHLESCNNYKFVRGDICDMELVSSLFEQYHFDYVINFAAETHVDRSIINPDQFVKTNVNGTLTLLNTCLKYGIKKYHQVSTDEVYGDLPLDRKDLLFSETSLLKPSSPYSASKASADLLVLSYYRTYHLPVTISRCSNNYGPYQFLEKLIPLMIDNAINNKPLPIYGKGENVRDWLYVYDHCEAIDLIVRSDKVGEVYNIGSNNEHCNLEIVKMILNHLNKPESLIQFVQDRPGHDLRYAINYHKIHDELGWMPKYNFKDGLASTIEWYLNNKEWINDLKTGEYNKWIETHYNK